MGGILSKANLSLTEIRYHPAHEASRGFCNFAILFANIMCLWIRGRINFFKVCEWMPAHLLSVNYQPLIQGLARSCVLSEERVIACRWLCSVCEHARACMWTAPAWLCSPRGLASLRLGRKGCWLRAAGIPLVTLPHSGVLAALFHSEMTVLQ